MLGYALILHDLTGTCGDRAAKCRIEMRIDQLPYDEQIKAEELAQAYVNANCLVSPDTDVALLEKAAVRARIDELQRQRLKAKQATRDWCKTIAIELIEAGRNGSTNTYGTYDTSAVSSGIKLLLELENADQQHPLIAVQINTEVDSKVDKLIKQYAMPY